MSDQIVASVKEAAQVEARAMRCRAGIPSEETELEQRRSLVAQQLRLNSEYAYARAARITAAREKLKQLRAESNAQVSKEVELKNDKSVLQTSEKKPSGFFGALWGGRSKAEEEKKTPVTRHTGAHDEAVEPALVEDLTEDEWKLIRSKFGDEDAIFPKEILVGGLPHLTPAQAVAEAEVRGLHYFLSLQKVLRESEAATGVEKSLLSQLLPKLVEQQAKDAAAAAAAQQQQQQQQQLSRISTPKHASTQSRIQASPAPPKQSHSTPQTNAEDSLTPAMASAEPGSSSGSSNTPAETQMPKSGSTSEDSSIVHARMEESKDMSVLKEIEVKAEDKEPVEAVEKAPRESTGERAEPEVAPTPALPPHTIAVEDAFTGATLEVASVPSWSEATDSQADAAPASSSMETQEGTVEPTPVPPQVVAPAPAPVVATSSILPEGAGTRVAPQFIDPEVDDIVAEAPVQKKIPQRFSISKTVNDVTKLVALIQPLIILGEAFVAIKNWHHPRVTAAILLFLLNMTYQDKLSYLPAIFVLILIWIIVMHAYNPWWLELVVAPWAELDANGPRHQARNKYLQRRGLPLPEEARAARAKEIEDWYKSVRESIRSKKLLAKRASVAQKMATQGDHDEKEGENESKDSRLRRRGHGHGTTTDRDSATEVSINHYEVSDMPAKSALARSEDSIAALRLVTTNSTHEVQARQQSKPRDSKYTSLSDEALDAAIYVAQTDVDEWLEMVEAERKVNELKRQLDQEREQAEAESNTLVGFLKRTFAPSSTLLSEYEAAVAEAKAKSSSRFIIRPPKGDGSDSQETDIEGGSSTSTSTTTSGLSNAPSSSSQHRVEVRSLLKRLRGLLREAEYRRKLRLARSGSGKTAEGDEVDNDEDDDADELDENELAAADDAECDRLVDSIVQESSQVLARPEAEAEEQSRKSSSTKLSDTADKVADFLARKATEIRSKIEAKTKTMRPPLQVAFEQAKLLQQRVKAFRKRERRDAIDFLKPSSVDVSKSLASAGSSSSASATPVPRTTPSTATPSPAESMPDPLAPPGAKQSLTRKILSSVLELPTLISSTKEKLVGIQTTVGEITFSVMRLLSLFRWRSPIESRQLVIGLFVLFLLLVFLPFRIIFIYILSDLFTQKWQPEETIFTKLVANVEVPEDSSALIFASEPIDKEAEAAESGERNLTEASTQLLDDELEGLLL